MPRASSQTKGIDMEQTIIDLYEFATISIPATLVCIVTWLYSTRRSGKLWIALVVLWIVYLFGLMHYTSAGTFYDVSRLGFELRWDRINLVPFSDAEVMMELNALNVALFVPLGALAPLLFKKRLPFWKIVLLGFVVSLVIELSQLFNLRATDVDDLVMNTLGTLIGYGIYALLPARWREKARKEAVGGVVICCLVVAFIGRFLLFDEMGFARFLYGF